MTTRFHIVPLPAPVAERVRADRADEHGNTQLAAIDADSGLPCRACLRDAEPGEPMLLFSYSPFGEPRPYRTVGPIFVHQKACAPAPDRTAVPAQLRRRLLALRSYDRQDRMVDADLVDGREIESLVERLFRDPAAHVIHVHNARAGCFACEIHRGDQ